MDDTVYRQAAIDAFLTELTKRERKNLLHTWSTVEVKYFITDMLEQLPSAQPEYKLDEWCTDCKEYDQKRHCCPRFNRVIRETVEEYKAAQSDSCEELDFVQEHKKIPVVLDIQQKGKSMPSAHEGRR